jgi:hypothetical protein
VWARLLVGWVVLISAEVFSGASLQAGLWHPWTLGVTYWLYFAHFFLFTTLAVRTGRTSLWSLYLWGVLFGLYESWITKVIWYGYAGDGDLVLGPLGPFGFSEISMVVLYHPLMSFVLPLSVACVLFPSLKALFPDLQWFFGQGSRAPVARAGLTLNFGLIVAMNSGGALNLAANLAFAVLVLIILLRLSRPVWDAPGAWAVVVFGRRGLAALCVYLAVLYGVTYVRLRPEGLPSVSVQLMTLAVYPMVLGGLWLHRRREPGDAAPSGDRRAETKAVLEVAGGVAGLGLLLAVWRGTPVVLVPVMVGFVAWTPLGLALTAIALATGVRERLRA